MFGLTSLADLASQVGIAASRAKNEIGQNALVADLWAARHHTCQAVVSHMRLSPDHLTPQCRSTGSATRSSRSTIKARVWLCGTSGPSAVVVRSFEIAAEALKDLQKPITAARDGEPPERSS